MGPAPTSPPYVKAVSRAQASLLARVTRVMRASSKGPPPDLVDAHFALYAAVPMKFTGLRRSQLVVTFHGPWADEVAVQFGSGRAVHWVRRRLEAHVYRRADHLLVLSEAFRRVLLERYHVDPWRLAVVQPGVDLDRFQVGSKEQSRLALDLPPDAFIAVALRRLVPRMGLDTLIQAWQGTVDTLPDGSRLVIAGDGPLLKQLKEQASGGKRAETILFPGRLSDDAVVHLFQAADVNVVPTASLEGFGLIVLEAAACGTPSIVSDVGGLPEAIRSLDSSLVVPPGDPDALAGRIAAAAEGVLPGSSDTRAFAERFSWAEHVRKRLDIYRRSRGARSMKPRVVFIDHVARLSGGEIALLRLLPYLTDVETHVILAEEGPFVSRLQAAGISVEVLPFASTGRELRKEHVRPGLRMFKAVPASLLYIWRLKRRLHQINPDLVHLNSLKAGVYGSLAAKAARIPSVWHVRDRISTDYLPGPAVRLVRTLIRRLPAAVIANSAETMRVLNLPDREPIIVHSVVPEGVTGAPSRQTSPAGTLRFGMVGRLAPWKGQDIFLRAFASAFPDAGHHATIVGAALFGEEPFEAELRTLVDTLGIRSRVDFRGFQEDVWTELRSMDVLVHASRTAEPFGQVVLEGMAAGLPVVAANEGGPTEIIDDEVSGLLYPAGDIDALAAALNRLAADTELRTRLSQGAIKRARDFRPEVVAGHVREAYRQILESTPAFDAAD